MSARDDVLGALRAAGGGTVSGQALAARLSVSRVAVAKHVRALRAAGYAIDALPGRGYTLSGTPDAPLPAEVRPHLTSSLWVRLDGGARTGSTNVDAVTLARAGAPHGTAVLAASQTAGRGRLGRPWESPEGGVYVSALLRPDLPPVALTGMPLAVATGVASALERFGVEALVKWPNDLRWNGAKLAGVLLELSAETDRTEWLVVGVGLNVRRPPRPTPGAAYLEDAASACGRAEAAAAVLDGIAEGYLLLAQDGFAAVRERFGRRDALAGAEVSAWDAQGSLIARGRAEGVDETGRLRVREGGEVVRVVSGDITLSDPGRSAVDPDARPGV